MGKADKQYREQTYVFPHVNSYGTYQKNGDKPGEEGGLWVEGGSVLQVEGIIFTVFQGNLSPEQLLTHISYLWLTESFSVYMIVFNSHDHLMRSQPLHFTDESTET